MMHAVRRFFQSSGLKLISLVIAIILWIQVHGQGVGSVSMDVPLQVQGLPQNMVIVNDLPDEVRVTVSGLQARLSSLDAHEIHVPLDASGLNEPGVTERALKVSDIHVPIGLRIEKVQPDRIELQVDRVVTRQVAVHPRLDLPEGWVATDVSVTPAEVELSGPEVWLDALPAVQTASVRPEAAAGPFEVKANVESPAGKAIRLVHPNVLFIVHGVLNKKETGKKEQGGGKP
ncbi:MAG TPA: CdaR family protein [Mariprofundaceae bacterium]|nr:CdaR family protein [Mariprofundaceae bacterium]